MGTSASKTSLRTPSDSDYYLATQMQEPVELIPSKKLLKSYAHCYVDYLEALKKQLHKEYKFKAKLDDAEGKSVTILRSRGRLSPSAINKTLNQFCKEGHLHCNDVVIRFAISSEIPQSAKEAILRKLGTTSLPSSIVIKAEDSAFQSSWFNSWSVTVELEPAEVDGADFGAFDFLVDGVGNSRVGVDECCVCLSAMQDGSALVSLPCDHQMHVACRNGVVRHARDEQPLCPLCRRAF
jgi:hypothetical protein